MERETLLCPDGMLFQQSFLFFRGARPWDRLDAKVVQDIELCSFEEIGTKLLVRFLLAHLLKVGVAV